MSPITPTYPGSRLAPRVAASSAACTALNLIALERHAQEDEYGPSDYSDLLPVIFPVLIEEVGEVATAMLDKEPPSALLAELIQVAAVACQAAEALIVEYPGLELELVADYVERGLCERRS